MSFLDAAASSGPAARPEGAPGSPRDEWAREAATTGLQAVAADAALSLAAAADGGGRGDEECAAVVRGRLAPELAATLFAAALEALRAPPKAQLLPALRCARGVWRRLLADSTLRPLVSLALPPAPPATAAKDDAPPALPPGAHPLSRCAAALAAALFSGLQRAKKRSPAAVAAFVNTAFLPAAFASREPAVLALHGPDGPLRWLTRRLVEEGGRSARLMSLVGLALAPALAARPALMGEYRPELRRILLFGVRSGRARAPPGQRGASSAGGSDGYAPPARAALRRRDALRASHLSSASSPAFLPPATGGRQGGRRPGGRRRQPRRRRRRGFRRRRRRRTVGAGGAAGPSAGGGGGGHRRRRPRRHRVRAARRRRGRGAGGAVRHGRAARRRRPRLRRRRRRRRPAAGGDDAARRFRTRRRGRRGGGGGRGARARRRAVGGAHQLCSHRRANGVRPLPPGLGRAPPEGARRARALRVCVRLCLGGGGAAAAAALRRSSFR